MQANRHDSPPAAPSPVDAARSLAGRLRASAEQIERDRRVPSALVAAMADAGLFAMCMPKTLGGGEVDVATLIRTIEEVSAGDGSAGWCLMIGATSNVLSAYLPEDAVATIYGAPGIVTGGVFAPLGKAIAVDGGYRVSGRWPFASGCQHCTWLMGGSVVFADGAPRLLPSGAPDGRLMLFPAGEAQIIDTWSVSGLRGTGSHDISVADLFVPGSHSVSLITDRPRHTGPLYLFPIFGLLALGIAGVALGIARRAIDELVHLGGGKMPTGSRKRLSERAVIQMQVAQAEATLRSARAFLLDAVGETWNAAATAGEISVEQRALLRLAATHAAISCAQAVDWMYNAGGGTSIYASNPLQRCFRDIHVVTQHMMVAPPTYELTGRIFLGVDTDASQL